MHNRVADEDQAVHGWYRFVLSFPPHLVRDYLTGFGVERGQIVLDPFCGTGTTLVEAKKQGISGLGIEANPMAALASTVKTNWSVDPNLLRSASIAIVSRLTREFAAENLSFGKVRPNEIAERRSLFGLLDLDEEASSLLLKGSISPLPLHRSLRLKREIVRADPGVQELMLLGLAWCLVNGVGNIRFGPEVGVSKPKDDADVLGLWQAQMLRMAMDIEQVEHLKDIPTHVHCGDSRDGSIPFEPGSVDAVITSPPYPNEKDYTRTTRLESVVLGLLRNKQDLRALKGGLVRSNTRNVYVDDNDHTLVESNAEIQRIAEEIEEKRIELGKTSGFERLYHKVTRLYFGGMARHFQAISKFLKPGAKLAYVVGDQASYLRVMIRTGELLAEVAQQQGYELERIDLFRTRFATATKEQLREEVVILKWPGPN